MLLSFVLRDPGKGRPADPARSPDPATARVPISEAEGASRQTRAVQGTSPIHRHQLKWPILYQRLSLQRNLKSQNVTNISNHKSDWGRGGNHKKRNYVHRPNSSESNYIPYTSPLQKKFFLKYSENLVAKVKIKNNERSILFRFNNKARTGWEWGNPTKHYQVWLPSRRSLSSFSPSIKPHLDRYPRESQESTLTVSSTDVASCIFQGSGGRGELLALKQKEVDLGQKLKKMQTGEMYIRDTAVMEHVDKYLVTA